jgi:hypothetical protein
VPAVGPFPDWDDPEDVRWGLLPFALFRGIASLILGYDPVAERQRQKLAKESQENFKRLSPLERETYENLHERYGEDGATPSADR